MRKVTFASFWNHLSLMIHSLKIIDLRMTENKEISWWREEGKKGGLEGRKRRGKSDGFSVTCNQKSPDEHFLVLEISTLPSFLTTSHSRLSIRPHAQLCLKAPDVMLDFRPPCSGTRSPNLLLTNYLFPFIQTQLKCHATGPQLPAATMIKLSSVLSCYHAWFCYHSY